MPLAHCGRGIAATDRPLRRSAPASGAGGFSIISTTDVSSDLEIRLERLQISGGVASIDGGGGIFAQAEMTLVHSIVSGNNAFGDGGGVRATESLTLISSTVSDNDTLREGLNKSPRKLVDPIRRVLDALEASEPV